MVSEGNEKQTHVVRVCPLHRFSRKRTSRISGFGKREAEDVSGAKHSVVNVAMGQKPVPPVNIRIPTKID